MNANRFLILTAALMVRTGMLLGAEVSETVVVSLAVPQPGEFEISWPRQTALDGWVYEVEVATDPSGPWRPLIGRVLQWGPWVEDLKRTHRTAIPSRFFRVARVGFEGLLAVNLSPAQATAVHQGFLTERNLAFDEAFVTFHEPTDQEQLGGPDDLRWQRVQQLSPTEAWFRAVDGLSSGDRGQDLAAQLAALNAREDVKVAYAVLMYQNLRQFTAPRVIVCFKAGQPYGDLMQLLGDQISRGAAVNNSPDTYYFNLPQPKETNLYELLYRFRSHAAVEWATFDGLLQIELLGSPAAP